MPWIKSCLCKREKKRPQVSAPIHLLLKNDDGVPLGSQDNEVTSTQPKITFLAPPQLPVQHCHNYTTTNISYDIPCQHCHDVIPRGSPAVKCGVCKFQCHDTCKDKSNKDPARFSDTSWQIHRQWSLSHARAFPSVEGPGRANIVQLESDLKLNIPNGVDGDGKSESTPTTVQPRPLSRLTVNGDNNNNEDSATRSTTEITVTLVGKQSNDGSIKPASTIQPSSPSPAPSTSPSSRVLVNGRSTPVPLTNGTIHSSSTNNSAGGFSNMDLVYVTERIIALRLPPGSAGIQNAAVQARSMLAAKHGERYLVFDLSDPTSEDRDCMPLLGPHRFVGWPRGLAPSLERLCSICKEIETWLAGSSHRIAVMHSRGDRQRLGTVVAAYMQYSAICGSEDQALDRYSMKRFLDESVGALRMPSHKRYVEYFAGLLSGTIKINSAPQYLTHVTVLGAPHFNATGGCRAFLKIYEGLTHVYTSGIYLVSPEVRQFTVNLGSLRLRGDILIRCYHRTPSSGVPGAPNTREVIFSCQFHTCAVTDFTLHFGKHELDQACDDSRFPKDGGVTLNFSATPNLSQSRAPAPTPAVPVEQGDHVTRWDSVAELAGPGPDSRCETNAHTYGPLDGSLYATISKSRSEQSSLTPLTVSMDSGISSSSTTGPGITTPHNTCHLSQRSTVTCRTASSISSNSPPLATPSSLPSQQSPAEDRHRELDELLSDMMMNVQNIPDIHPHSAPPLLTPHQQYTTSRDHVRDVTGSESTNTHFSYKSSSTGGVGSVANGSNGANGANSDLRNGGFDRAMSSASNTSGFHQINSSTSGGDFNKSGYYTDSSVRSGSASDINKQNYYRVETTTTTQGEEGGEIPYHAREDSTPFTYGAVPPPGTPQQNASIMIKMQSGLSSPSLVRKAAGRPSSIQPSPTTQGYKYTSYNNSTSEDPIEKLFTQQANDSYRNSELSDDVFVDRKSLDTMRRSQTEGALRNQQTDGTFRSQSVSTLRSPISPTSTNGNSSYSSIRSNEFDSSAGLTWLQLQQQKLRAKKEVQLREDRRPLDTRLLSEIRTTSTRHSRPTASHRLDGYTSDTTAFADDDEDFSIPLHVNTVSNTPRSPVLPHRTSSRKYHTLTHTTTTETRQGAPYGGTLNGTGARPTNERPFVAVKRAHEQNRKLVGSTSPPISPASALAAAPHGLIRSESRTSDNVDIGLLSLAERDNISPRRYNGNTMDPAQKHDALANLIASLAEVSSSSTCTSSALGQPSGTSEISGASGSTPEPPSPLITPPLPPPHAWMDQMREESFSSWRTMSTSEAETSPTGGSPRAQTPAFPVHPRTPYNHAPSPGIFENQQVTGSGGLPPKSPTTQRRYSGYSTSSTRTSSTLRSPQSPVPDWSKDPYGSQSNGDIFQYNQSSVNNVYNTYNRNGSATPTSLYNTTSRRSSGTINEALQEVAPAHVKFVRDSSKYWYKPTITREEAINLVRDQQPGTFVVRDSNSFANAYGLALKVASPPPGAVTRGGNPGDELVRHFLVEPTAAGVRLKGCNNEPVFSSLSALVYQHSLTPLALPCKLIIPERELNPEFGNSSPAAIQLQNHGAACNVLYLYSMDMEALTGPQAIRRAVTQLYSTSPLPQATIVHFKVSNQGITLTDNTRKLFFRRHYKAGNVSYCGLDPDDHRWSYNTDSNGVPSSKRVFAFVARRPGSSAENQCHVFAELEAAQPAQAIVAFVDKVLGGNQILL